LWPTFKNYNFLNAYNFAKRLKTLRGLTPYEEIIKWWKNEPERFKINPNQHNLGLNIYMVWKQKFGGLHISKILNLKF